MITIRTLLLPLAIAAAVAACSGPAAPAATAASAVASAPAPAVHAAPAIQARSGTYALDPTHTNVLVQWSHFGFSQPSAAFAISAGTLVYDAADVGNSRVEVTIPVAAIDTFVPALDEHLRKADFFDVVRYPQAGFKSTSVQADGVNRLRVTGDLTIKGITKPVALAVTLNGAGEHPMLKQQAIGFSASAMLKRSDFGMGAFAPGVSDEVQLRITTEGALVNAAAPAVTEE
ncbi:YceI family protein [Thermomonas paludicola]|uniref:YceI family protein n=1 Tax=Thermomonas paludicola TaxID=2884874 RepID=UPI002114C032|nr:YceI family protein [Thermomonas paludicola]